MKHGVLLELGSEGDMGADYLVSFRHLFSYTIHQNWSGTKPAVIATIGFCPLDLLSRSQSPRDGAS
jgi:hypothetical protein